MKASEVVRLMEEKEASHGARVQELTDRCNVLLERARAAEAEAKELRASRPHFSLVRAAGVQVVGGDEVDLVDWFVRVPPQRNDVIEFPAGVESLAPDRPGTFKGWVVASVKWGADDPYKVKVALFPAFQ